jgi:voltage-gated potassium channel
VNGVTRHRILVTVVAVGTVFAAGTIGFHELLDEAWHAAFYRTVVTTTLTGLDSTPRGVGAELLTIALVLAGVTIFGYLVAQLLQEVAENIRSGSWREKRRRKMIDKLENHFIICGFGRVGRRAAEEFAGSRMPFVVLDVNPDALAAAQERDVHFIHGDGGEDDDLTAAGIDRALGLIASADSDTQNLYITLSARQRRADLTIVARASDDEAERKLRLAGATRVVQPYSAAGVEMAKLALKPEVAAFLELTSSHGGPDMRFEELELSDASPVVGQTIRELRIRRDTGALVVALRKANGVFDTTPSPDARLDEGDVVIAMGTIAELQLLEELLAPTDARAR